MFISSFVKTLWQHWKGKEPLLPKFVIEMRHKTCVRCEYRRRGWFRYYCYLCFCTLNRRKSLFNKLAFPQEECPIRSWSKCIGAWGGNDINYDEKCGEKGWSK